MIKALKERVEAICAAHPWQPDELIIKVSSHGEPLGIDCYESQLSGDIAYKAREPMVGAALSICRMLSGESGVKISPCGCYFLSEAVDRKANEICRFPSHQRRIGGEETASTRAGDFYGKDFWSSNMVVSWVVVQVVWHWYDLRRGEWCSKEAERIYRENAGSY